MLEHDENGAPLTRWDGETKKVHPVSGRLVPDETARVEVFRYVKPRATKWPRADFVVGNPPFIGKREMRLELGDRYVEAIRASYEVPETCDFVMYWWHIAAELLKKSNIRRFGFITTAQITGDFNASLVADHVFDEEPVSIVFAIPDHPWIDNKDGASVRIAMTTAAPGIRDGVLEKLVHVRGEAHGRDSEQFTTHNGYILPSLSIGPNVKGADRLKSNDGLAVVGFQFNGRGFGVTSAEAKKFLREERGLRPYLRPFVSGNDITQVPRYLWMFDFYGLTENELSSRFPKAYQHLLVNVKPERDVNPRPARKRNWWIFGEALSPFRPALAGLPQIIVAPITSKHRVFTYLPAGTGGDSNTVMVASSEALLLGILSSRAHRLWAIRGGTKRGIGNHPRYNKSRCFDAFPFPVDVAEELASTIRAKAEELDALRKRVTEEHPDLTLTKLHNVMEVLRDGRPLTETERDIHDRGLVTLMFQQHEAIDKAVASAYGWPDGLADEDVLTRLVELNKERAAEEAKGIVHWLRPEFQAPEYAGMTHALDFGEEQEAPPTSVIFWPVSLPEQVSAVQTVLASSASPLTSQDVARAFSGKRAASFRPVLDALTAIGMARRLLMEGTRPNPKASGEGRRADFGRRENRFAQAA